MKNFTRRLALTALSMLVAGQTYAQAQSPSASSNSFPNQAVKLIVPYPAGGATDALARMVGQKMQESWGQSALIENKPGAGGTLGANLVAKGAADGHTALFTITALDPANHADEAAL